MKRKFDLANCEPVEKAKGNKRRRLVVSFTQMQFEKDNLKQNKARKEEDKKREQRLEREKQERKELKKETEFDKLDEFCSGRKPTKPVALQVCSFNKLSRKYALENRLKEDNQWFGGWQKVEYFPGHFMWTKKTRDSFIY